jgi:CBS domain-containing protein
VRATTGRGLFRRVLVALDGSPLSWQAFTVSVHLAKALGASLRAVSVVEGPRTPPADHLSPSSSPRNRAPGWDWYAYFQQTQMLATAQAALTGVPIEVTTREGHASSMLSEVARAEGSDLLILGATGQEHPWSTTTGGTARRVANEAPCSVLLVRPPAGQQQVRDLMSPAVAWTTPDTSLSEIMNWLIAQGVKLLPIVNEQRQVEGVITLGSLLTQEEAYQHLDLRQASDTTRFLRHLRQLFQTEKCAGEVMKRPPIVVRDDVGIELAARWMLTHKVTRVPVVDGNGTLVGLLDQEHLLRSYTGLSQTPEMPSVPQREAAAPLPRVVGEVTLTRVPLIAQETPLAEVLQTIQRTPLRRVIVLKPDGTALGVIADRDLLAARGLVERHNPLLAFAGRFSLHFPEDLLRRRTASGPLAAHQVMKPHLFAVTPSTPVAEAIRVMIRHQIKRLVVVDNAGKPLGLVDRQQLLRLLIEGGASPG